MFSVQFLSPYLASLLKFCGTKVRSSLDFSFYLCFAGICDNGGTWEQGGCICPPGFSGDHCQDLDDRCQNGGSWSGISCVCPSTFHGSFCEFPVEQLDIGECPGPSLHPLLTSLPCTLLPHTPSSPLTSSWLLPPSVTSSLNLTNSQWLPY